MDDGLIPCPMCHSTDCSGFACPAVEMAPQALEWQPIATAPKDGTLVDLWLDKGDTRRITGCYWSESGLCWTDGDRYYLKGRVQPTHWMPLPEPPKEDK